ncbi:hypothetical protein [Streptomyces sp. NPDC093808]|uniref:hypothetical protein n=1 Tax=Streptomyces sp. NPDC093808 TaxID=3154985 RepID=UPI00344D3FA1
MEKRRFLAGPTAAFVLAGCWAATAVVWLVERPESGSSWVLLVCAGFSAPLWTVIGVQRLRARRTTGEADGSA